jgi:hypothetical protein
MSSSTTALYKDFLKINVPSLQRIGRGHIALMELFVSTARWGAEFIPSAQMKALTEQYPVIRDACFHVKRYSNRAAGICFLLEAQTPAFSALFERCLAQENRLIHSYRQEHHRKTSYSGDLARKAKSTKALEPIPYPGADVRNYTTSDAGARIYHADQGLTKEMKRIKFAGFHDFDIDACFPNIFRHLLQERGITEHPDFTAMCDSKTAFLQRIIDTECYTYALKYDTVKSIEKKAKAMRSRLFHPDSGFKLHAVGVPWYDELGKWIASTLQECRVEGAHMFFTTHEQRIIDTAFEVVGRDNIILRVHDGFVADVNGDIADILLELKEATGYKWTVELYEN